MAAIDLETKIMAPLAQILPFGYQNICFELKADSITLSGMVADESEKRAVDRAVSRITGISTVNDLITVGKENPLASVKEAIVQSLHNNVEIPAERIRICVTPGLIEVRGTVKWNYQKKATLDIVRSMKEDREVIDSVIVDPKLSAAPVKEEILNAMKTNRRLKADDINIIVNGNHVILVGSVPDENQKLVAERVIGEFPTVRSIQNELYIR